MADASLRERSRTGSAPITLGPMTRARPMKAAWPVARERLVSAYCCIPGVVAWHAVNLNKRLTLAARLRAPTVAAWAPLQRLQSGISLWSLNHPALPVGALCTTITETDPPGVARRKATTGPDVDTVNPLTI